MSCTHSNTKASICQTARIKSSGAYHDFNSLTSIWRFNSLVGISQNRTPKISEKRRFAKNSLECSLCPHGPIQGENHSPCPSVLAPLAAASEVETTATQSITVPFERQTFWVPLVSTSAARATRTTSASTTGTTTGSGVVQLVLAATTRGQIPLTSWVPAIPSPFSSSADFSNFGLGFHGIKRPWAATIQIQKEGIVGRSGSFKAEVQSCSNSSGKLS